MARDVRDALALASMRPPQKTGENVERTAERQDRAAASMRPPQKTGENTDCLDEWTQRAPLQ